MDNIPIKNHKSYDIGTSGMQDGFEYFIFIHFFMTGQHLSSDLANFEE